MSKIDLQDSLVNTDSKFFSKPRHILEEDDECFIPLQLVIQTDRETSFYNLIKTNHQSEDLAVNDTKLKLLRKLSSKVSIETLCQLDRTKTLVIHDEDEGNVVSADTI